MKAFFLVLAFLVSLPAFACNCGLNDVQCIVNNCSETINPDPNSKEGITFQGGVEAVKGQQEIPSEAAWENLRYQQGAPIVYSPLEQMNRVGGGTEYNKAFDQP